eukprot:COSAG05_NODE_2306_length_3249_cov_2.568889_5_plen_143_part_00
MVYIEASRSLLGSHLNAGVYCCTGRRYRRLLQMGLNTAELWNNIGLCCFNASQYDMCLVCYERALALAADGAIAMARLIKVHLNCCLLILDNAADVWYNIGQLAIGIGDLGLAYSCQCACCNGTYMIFFATQLPGFQSCSVS